MKIKIYHGSDKIITTPIFGYGKPNNDYGLGFYCTKQLDLAKEWSVDEKRDGFVNCYELELEGLKVLDLTEERYTVLDWLYILLRNRVFELRTPLALDAIEYLTRNFSIDYQNYDVIVGYRADDSYFSFAEDFLNGSISLRQVSEAMRLGNLGLQVVLKSEQAFEQISFLNQEDVDSTVWYPKKKNRDRDARTLYFTSTKAKRGKGDIYITTIIDEEMKRDDPRIQ